MKPQEDLHKQNSYQLTNANASSSDALVLCNEWKGVIPTQAHSQLPLREQKRVAECLQTYGDDFNAVCLRQFVTLGKERFYPTMMSAILAETPALQFVDRVYGRGCSLWWLEKQIKEVMIFTGILDKMSTYQRVALASALRSEAVPMCVTLSEMMVFFSRFEKGNYKTFHGYERPNPQIVTESFAMFIDELVRVREDARAEKKKREDAEFYRRMREEAVPPPAHIIEKWKNLTLGEPPKPKPKEVAKKDNSDFYLGRKYIVRHKNGESSKPLYPIEVVRYTETLDLESYTIEEVKDNERQDKEDSDSKSGGSNEEG